MILCNVAALFSYLCEPGTATHKSNEIYVEKQSCAALSGDRVADGADFLQEFSDADKLYVCTVVFSILLIIIFGVGVGSFRLKLVRIVIVDVAVAVFAFAAKHTLR